MIISTILDSNIFKHASLMIRRMAANFSENLKTDPQHAAGFAFIDGGQSCFVTNEIKIQGWLKKARPRGLSLRHSEVSRTF
ncbi:MAG: hypothetical protein GY809_14275 [Planctomycetes bacterium]|nr:hypothetical protein [Planctomycetota bacterium]